MTRRGVILPGAGEWLRPLLDEWQLGLFTNRPWPRAAWLSAAEDTLRPHYPSASSRDLNDTARAHAPFPLSEPTQRP